MPIYKYPLAITDEQTLLMPAGAKLLSVLNQREQLVLYAIIPAQDVAIHTRKILIRGTGHQSDEVYSDCQFLGSVSLRDGALVLHVFEGRWPS